MRISVEMTGSETDSLLSDAPSRPDAFAIGQTPLMFSGYFKLYEEAHEANC
jgi:hypothetical protein